MATIVYRTDELSDRWNSDLVRVLDGNLLIEDPENPDLILGGYAAGQWSAFESQRQEA
ncbi:hypothetical protein OS128_05170 [Corynebacterium sp. P5848]|uniref:hypothetical protein n=1 Tax=Corynebacterium marambiense TaxID=2765364 RepID=UPI002260D0F0|nr:hypothetical protein [Corynebacterium marambiense]MCX7542301.1 hypothetical protein [Corynebacterium marambiense]